MTATPDFPIDDTVGAWVPHGRFVLPGAPTGPLAGLLFGVKDLFDVAGHPTGAGNPRWLQTHPVPTRSSPLVDQLLARGATLMGKLVTDELAYSINGDNIHYGAPHNTLLPDRVTGGSSSGSAAAVAARLVDFALGTDTGGSTRVPASYCGLWGLRTTHGALSTQGLVALHPRYDTATWLAHDGDTFERVGRELLPVATAAYAPRRVLLPHDAWAEADALFQPLLHRVSDALCTLLATPSTTLALSEDGLDGWRQAYVTTGAHEGWQTHGDWITHGEPAFAPPIAQRWDAARTTTAQAAAQAELRVAQVRTHVRALLAADGVMVLPSAGGLPPLRDADPRSVDDLRVRTMRITCIAGLAGLPQVSIPLHGTHVLPGGHAQAVPLGVSLVGPAGSDLALIQLARRVADHCAAA
ncbi:MAG: amidase [Comamonadaceae bacterium]|nr:MAG: amidase [Comamonadaceae bacterium]